MSTEGSRVQIARDLRRLGLGHGDTVLVHASLKSMGRVDGGPEAVIDALRDVLGAEGTLLMPALSYGHVTPASPRFDSRITPSNVGLIAETFRLRPDVRRSIHPTHSVCALGPRTAELLDGHERDRTPCGPASPFRRNALGRGWILFLGCGLGPNTTMHAVEELVEPPYLWGDEVTVSVTDPDGRSYRAPYRWHGFLGWRQRYERVEALLPPSALVKGPVMGAAAHLVRAGFLWDAALEALRRDPLCFVQRLAT